jgi:hypothetical protein
VRPAEAIDELAANRVVELAGQGGAGAVVERQEELDQVHRVAKTAIGVQARSMLCRGTRHALGQP